MLQKIKDNSGRAGAFYHTLLAMYYRFLVPKGDEASVSVVVAAGNEAGNIEKIFRFSFRH